MIVQDKKIKTYIDEHFHEAIALLETLGKIPSPTRHEDKRAQFCKSWFKEQGANNVSIDEQKNVICSIDCDKHDDIVVFMAHTDIVFDDQTELPMKRSGNKLFAPGIGDNTANLVNLMMATKYFLLNKSNFKKGVLIIANSCEEGLGNLDGCKYIFETFGDKISEFYSFDGYMSQCTSIPVGSHRYSITVKEEGGHSYADFGNENAIHTMSSIIQSLYEIEVPTKETTTFNVGHIQGGSTVNSIAEEATILYEYRSPSEKCLSIMKERFYNIISQYTEKDISVELLGERPGKGVFDKNKLKSWTDKNIKIIKKHYDGDINETPYSTDANIPLSRGVLANTIGTIIGDGAHTRDEWVDVSSIPSGLGIILNIMLQYVE